MRSPTSGSRSARHPPSINPDRLREDRPPHRPNRRPRCPRCPHADAGEFDAATAAYEQALTIYRQVGGRLGQAETLTNLARVYSDSGDHDAATEAYEQALTIYRQVGHRLGQAETLTNLARTRGDSGDHDATTDLHEQALTIYRDIGHRLGHAGQHSIPVGTEQGYRLAQPGLRPASAEGGVV